MNKPVAKQDLVPDLKIAYHSFIADRNAFVITYDIICGKGEDITVIQHYFSFFKGSYAVFGTLCVKENCNGEIELCSDTFYDIYLFKMILM